MTPARSFVFHRCRSVSLRVQALAMPVNPHRPRRIADRNTKSGEPVVIQQRKQTARLTLTDNDTDLHNSFYMPASAWTAVLVVESSPSTVTEIGPTVTDKYGM